jgi:hypothetical protein
MTLTQSLATLLGALILAVSATPETGSHNQP